ncbi:MAG: YbaB/EbfC family nucleoid-associated protein [Mycoplasmataceae bacterium]|jgi:DNA-binding YbaB/EbfC family protein|nr:YbaB/EbfC family nucleoid-associated protein [Mycoplasmataceae bacterium]
MNINQLMQQAQKLQQKTQQKLVEFEQKEFEFDYKQGSVVVRMRGDYKLTNILVNDVLVDKDDKTTMQEMIAEAINAAIESITQDRETIQQSATGHNLPI